MEFSENCIVFCVMVDVTRFSAFGLVVIEWFWGFQFVEFGDFWMWKGFTYILLSATTS